MIATGKQLPVKHADCYRDMSKGVADAASYILQNVLVSPGTASNRGLPGRHAAAKTGTANGGFYAAFAGYTPTLAGYVSVFNPTNPTGAVRWSAQARVTTSSAMTSPTVLARCSVTTRLAPPGR